MANLQIRQFPCLTDNYGVLIHDPASELTASIDAPDAGVIERELAVANWRLTHVFTTHHHGDHTGGNIALKARTGCTIFGPRKEAAKIPKLDKPLAEGDAVHFGGFDVHVIETPGHTAGHVTYSIPSAGVAFAGDTLFAMGCGRVLEGTAEMMWASLRKIMGLPDETLVYCGHEYTVANARFALTVDPGNAALQERAKEAEAARAAGKPTLPTRIGLERATNPFLRVDDAGIRARLGMTGSTSAQVFAEIRERKNAF